MTCNEPVGAYGLIARQALISTKVGSLGSGSEPARKGRNREKIGQDKDLRLSRVLRTTHSAVALRAIRTFSQVATNVPLPDSAEATGCQFSRPVGI